MKQIRLTKPTIYGGVVILYVMLGIFAWISYRKIDKDLQLPVIDDSVVELQTDIKNSDMEITTVIQHPRHTDRNVPKTISASHRVSQKVSIDDFLQMTEEERWVLEDQMSPKELVELTTQISSEDLLQLMDQDIRIAKERGHFDSEYVRDLETVSDETKLVISLDEKLQMLLQRSASEELSDNERDYLDKEINQLTSEIFSSADHINILEEERLSRVRDLRYQAEEFLNSIEDRHSQESIHLKTDAEYQQQQAVFEKSLADLKNTIIEGFSDIARIEEIDGRFEVIPWHTEETTEDISSVSAGANEQHINEPSLSSNTNYDFIESIHDFKSWRDGLDIDYFDVVVSQSLSEEELNTFFPTEAKRQSLKSRTTEMQKVVVSKMREVVSEIQGATDAEKREFARKLVSDNFDSDFAESVISQLERDDE